jgi:hypothetical protein
MAVATKPTSLPIEWLDEAEGRAFFDEQARAMLDLSGEEFLRKWDAGDYRAMLDDTEHPQVRRLAALIPFARQHA